MDNKSAVIGYGAGAVVALWLSTVIVNAIGSVPLLPKLMELVGLGYSAWFTYRYLLFKVRHTRFGREPSISLQIGSAGSAARVVTLKGWHSRHCRLVLTRGVLLSQHRAVDL